MQNDNVYKLVDILSTAGWNLFRCANDKLQIASHLIKNDVVPVVRCKDCKCYIEDGNCFCFKTGSIVAEDDYCSYGERKT